MTETVSTDRKFCPHCGHSNRIGANICSQCGRSFVLVKATGTLRKRCSNCGHDNRLRANVCSACGHSFQVEKAAKAPTKGVKWCPQCGKKRNLQAKVCNRCGYHFEKLKTGTAPLVQMPQPAIQAKPKPPAPVKLPPDLKGEPAPYISSDEFDRLREGGVYHSNVFVRLLYQMSKKDAP